MGVDPEFIDVSRVKFDVLQPHKGNVFRKCEVAVYIFGELRQARNCKFVENDSYFYADTIVCRLLEAGNCSIECTACLYHVIDWQLKSE